MLWTKVLGLSFLVAFSSAADLNLIRRDDTENSLPDLSLCSKSCLSSSLSAVTDCDPTTQPACLCTSVTYAEAVTACLTANCTVVDALETRRSSAVTCKEPVRDNSALTERVSWAMFALATIAIVVRFFSRLPHLGGSGFSWDDYTIFICWALLIPSDVVLNRMTSLGLGRDIWMLLDPNFQITRILYFFYVSEWTYVIEIALVKISILLLYLRMWPESRSDARWFRYSCIMLIAALGIFTVTCLIVLGLQCAPLSLSWTRWDGQHEGKCINLNKLIYATAGLNILFDILTIGLPIPRLLSLAIPTRKKIAVCVAFSIGGFVTLCSILRLRTLAVWGSDSNVTWNYNPIAIWSNVEINLGVVCACVPAIAGLLQRSYTYYTGDRFSAAYYGRHSPTLTKDGQNGDRGYEARLSSFSDTDLTRQPIPAILRVDSRGRVYSDDSAEAPPVRTGPADDTVERMINSGYSAFASLKR